MSGSFPVLLRIAQARGGLGMCSHPSGLGADHGSHIHMRVVSLRLKEAEGHRLAQSNPQPHAGEPMDDIPPRVLGGFVMRRPPVLVGSSLLRRRTNSSADSITPSMVAWSTAHRSAHGQQHVRALTVEP